jgi:hypothetical protein
MAGTQLSLSRVRLFFGCTWDFPGVASALLAHFEQPSPSQPRTGPFLKINMGTNRPDIKLHMCPRCPQSRRKMTPGSRPGGWSVLGLPRTNSAVRVLWALLAVAAVGAALGAPSPLDQVFETIAADSAALQSAAAGSLLNAVLAGSQFAAQPISVAASASPLLLDPANNCPAPPTVVQTYMNDMFLSFGVRWGGCGVRGGGDVWSSPHAHSVLPELPRLTVWVWTLWLCFESRSAPWWKA